MDISEQLMKEMRQELRDIHVELTNIKVQIATLKVRASLWGAVAGAIPVIAVLLARIL